MKRPPPSRERGRPPKSGHRRALSHLGGPVETQGLEEVAVRLATIMGGDMDADGARAHVHGFHAYPARMHPTLARRAIELMSPTGGTVLDPFCGSGTVLVESRLAARQSWGVDLNPLAVLLARLKSRAATPQELQFILSTAGKVAQHADSRRREKRGATRRYPAEDVQLFDPHVLLELDGLRDGLGQVHGEFVRDALRLVFSAILVKVSRQPGDTSTSSVPRRLAAGFTIALFEKKADELAQRIDSFRRMLPPRAPVAKIQQGDARRLDHVPDGSIHFVLSSPPYAGTYDYVEHHRLRLRWLDMPMDEMQRDEIGARRHLAPLHHTDAVRRFQDDLTRVLASLRPKLVPDAKVAMLIADSVVGSNPVWADPLVRRCGDRAGLPWVATASQARPHFHGPSHRAFANQPRREHLVVLSRAER